jgi:hypothetical protein
MKKVLIYFMLLMNFITINQNSLNAAVPASPAATSTDPTLLGDLQSLCTVENAKTAGLGILGLSIVATIPLYISSKNKIDSYQKMLNIHHRFIEVFPYFESWKKNKNKIDLIKLINEADREALVYEHQQARYLYNALQIAIKNYNNYMYIFQYIIKKKVSLEKLTDLDAAMDFLRIFIKKSELIVTAKLIEKIKKDPYFSLETKAPAIKASVLFPHILNEQQAIEELKYKIQQIGFTLTPYKEFLLSKKVSPTRDLLLQTINELLHIIKKDLDYYHIPLSQSSVNFAAIHTPINPSSLPQQTPIILPKNPIIDPSQAQQSEQNWKTQILAAPTNFLQKIKNIFIKPSAAPVAQPIIQMPIQEAQLPATPSIQLPAQSTIEAPAPVVAITPEVLANAEPTPVMTKASTSENNLPTSDIVQMPATSEQVTTSPATEEQAAPIVLSEEEEKKAQIKKYATIGLLATGSLLLSGIIALGIATK